MCMWEDDSKENLDLSRVKTTFKGTHNLNCMISYLFTTRGVSPKKKLPYRGSASITHATIIIEFN